VIGLAFEISDFRHAKAHPESITKPKRFLEAEPGFLDILNYFYHFAGLFTGPYYTYQMLLDSQDPVLFTKWSPLSEIRERALRLCWSAPLFIIFNNAWAVAESMCVTIGLGIYPADSKPRTVVGPTDLGKYKELKGRADVEYNSEAIVNLDIPEIEMSDGFRSGIRAWNKVELTMFVSALWHGTYAGYFMSFLIVPMCATVEDIIFKYVPLDPETKKRPAWFRYLYLFTLRNRGFDMLATGFLLKNFQDTHRFWSSLYYWLLIVTLPIYVIDKIYTLSKKTQKKKELKKEL
ncbi:MBOAT family protein, partial [Oesophagostomum dentatum]